MNYYEEIIDKIKTLLKENKHQEASSLLKEELSMPYIPFAYQQELEALSASVETNYSMSSFTDEELEEYLHSSYDKQLKAVTVLDKLNLRHYQDIINRYLSHQPNRLVASLLIESLIMQNIDYEVTYCIEDISYTFIPCFVEQPAQSDGYQKAKSLFDMYLNHNPSLHKMAMDLLIQECMLSLPITYDEKEGEAIGYYILQYLYKMFHEEEALNELNGYYPQYCLLEGKLICLNIDI